MKNFIKISVLAVVLSSSLFSCNPEKVTEGDLEMDAIETQSINGRGRVRDIPTSDED